MVEQRGSARVSVKPAEIPYFLRTKVGVLEIERSWACRLPGVIRSRLCLEERDEYLEIHVPQLVPVTEPRLILQAFKNSFQMLAKSLRKGPEPRYLVGITHEKLALAAKFFGFYLFGIDRSQLDQDTLTRIEDGYRLTYNYTVGKPMGEILVCYQQFDRFMARFARNENS